MERILIAQLYLIAVMLLLVWLTSGCGRVEPTRIEDTSVARYHAEFCMVLAGYSSVGGCGEHVESIEVVDVLPETEMTGFILGYCQALYRSENSAADTGFRRRILLLRSYWENVGEEEQRMLLFHEMGHCALNLSDNYDRVPDLMEGYTFPVESGDSVKLLREILK